MKTRWIGWMLAGCAAAGCEGNLDGLPDGPALEGVATVEGRLDADSGNQHSGFAAIRSAGVAADSVVAITVDSEIIAEATVEDGAFRFEELPPIEGPFFIEARQAGQATGRVLMPLGAAGGEVTTALPISAETTAEAAAFAVLQAQGEAVDPLALVTQITHEMAATAEAQALAAAALAAQVAERAALTAHAGFEVTAEAMTEVRAGAFERLSAAIDDARGGADEAAAWADFYGEAALALQAGLGATVQSRADAAAASGFALAAAFAGEAGYDAAVTFAGEQAARAEQAALEAAITGAAEGEARASVDAAFGGYFEALANARSAVDAQAAHDALIAALVDGQGQVRAVIEVMLAAEGAAASAIGLALEGALQVVTRATLTVGVDDGAAQVGEAYAALRARVRASIEASLGAVASAGFVDVLVEVVLADAARPSPDVVEGPAPDGEAGVEPGDDPGHDPAIEPVAVVEALIEGGAAAQAGAEALVDGLRGDVDGELARVVAVGADGRARVVAIGEVIADRARVEVPADVAAEGAAALQVLVAGEVVAAALLPGLPEDGALMALPPLSAESTVEAVLALRAQIEGHGDTAFVQRMIDDATATAALAEGELDALGTALWTAQSTFAAALEAEAQTLARAGAEASADFVAELAAAGEMGRAAAGEAHARFEAEVRARIEAATGAGAAAQAEAMAAATAAFESTLEAAASGRATLTLAAAEAQAELRNAADGAEQARAALATEGRAHGEALTAALAEHAEAVRAAADPMAIAAAGEALRAALVGEAEGITARLVAEARLDIVSRAAVEGALESLAQAEGRLAGALELAVRLDAVGAVDATGTADATLSAFADFAAQARAAGDVMGRVPDFEGRAEAVIALWTATSVVAPGD